jgi:flagellin
MASVINTNVASLNAQRNLNSSQSALATSLQRLSSGLRINSAKDDAAGLAISDRFTTQIRGLNQAARNANDAISLSQTAEGALGEVTNNLQRIRELAVQSANATNSASDRAALDLEVQQRLAEIDRISSQTSFNGQKILDGSFGQAAFQVGANVGETITLDLSTSMRPNQIGILATSQSVDLTTLLNVGTPAVAGSYTSGQLSSLDFDNAAVPFAGGSVATTTDISVFDYQAGAAVTFEVDGIGITLNTDLTDISGVVGKIQDDLDVSNAGEYVVAVSGADLTITKTATATNPTVAVVINNGTGTTEAQFTAATTPTTGTAAADTSNLVFNVDSSTVTINTDHSGDQAGFIADLQSQLDGISSGAYVATAAGAAGFSITAAVAGATPAALLDTFAASSVTGASGGTAVVAADVAAGATITLGATDLGITLGDSTIVYVGAKTYDTPQSLVDAVNTALAGNAEAVLNADNTMSIIADKTITITSAGEAVGLTLPPTVIADGSLTRGNILDVASSNDIIRRLDSALTSISDLRSTFGAIQNRFESTISNLGTAVENLSAARSRIMDADFAAETANLTRAQILQQAGTAMLSQANAIPQNVLSLLQG